MSIYGNPVMLGGGGGGSTNILSGTTNPTSAQGSNGQIYLQYLPPVGYTALQYLQFVTGAYIDTDIIPSNHFAELFCEEVSYINDKHWFGTSQGPNYYSFTTYSNKYYWGRNGTEANGGTWASGKHLLEYNKGSSYNVIIDGIILGNGYQISAIQKLMIGSRNDTANAADFRVYYLKLYDKSNDSLVRHLIPAKRNADSVLGLYDLVNDVFYTNAGSGTFIAGPEVTDNPINNAFAKVSGAWQDLIGTDITDVNLGGGGTPNVFSGTDVPSSSMGADGDVYIKYTVQGNSGLVDSQMGWACPPLYYAAKANTEYGSIEGRWYKKSYDAPGIVCYGLYNTGTLPGAANPYTFPMTISTTKNGASKIDGYTQQPTSDGEWKSCTYGGLTWWFDIGYGMGATTNASGGQLSLQPRIQLPNTVTTWAQACQYVLQTIGVVTGIATPGTYYVKQNGAWVAQT